MSNTDQQANSSAKSGFAFGISIVAAALLFVAGLVAVFQGISARMTRCSCGPPTMCSSST